MFISILSCLFRNYLFSSHCCFNWRKKCKKLEKKIVLSIDDVAQLLHKLNENNNKNNDQTFFEIEKNNNVASISNNQNNSNVKFKQKNTISKITNVKDKNVAFCSVTLNNLIRQKNNFVERNLRECWDKRQNSIDFVNWQCVHYFYLWKKIKKINIIIKLLHSICRFFIINNAIKIELSKSSQIFRCSKTKKLIIKRFVDLSKNCIKNCIYKKIETFKIFANTSCYFKINDKKKSITEKIRQIMISSTCLTQI